MRRNTPEPPINPPEPKHQHEHEFFDEDAEMVIEDGAVIFHEKCAYFDGPPGNEWSCEKTKSRMETAIRQVEETLEEMRWPNLFDAEIVEVRRVDDNE